MTSLQERIAQFRKMAGDDPDNELGHYRLGQLLMEDGQVEDAVKSFRRTVELSPQFAKAYQLLGSCLLQLKKRDDAVAILKQGYVISEEHGHFMPRDEMAKMLKDLGEQLPETKKRAEESTSGFRCQRPGCVYGARARPLAKPPMNDDLGKRILAKVCADCWNDWLKTYSIKVINELHLDLSREDHSAMYDQYMLEFFGFE